MGLGWMFFWLFCLFVAGAWGIAAISQAKARQRQELIDLVRGRKRSYNADESRPTLPDPPRQVQVQVQVPVPRTANLHKTMQSYEKTLTNGKTTQPTPPAVAENDAALRRVKRLYEKTIAEVERDNRRGQGYDSRQPGPCTLQIGYEDAGGVWSYRKIAPYKSGATNARFDAWCDTRKARRTFFFERIHSATDLRTGRLITRADVFRLIHPSRSVPSELE